MVIYHIYSANKFKQTNALGIKKFGAAQDKKDLSWIADDQDFLLSALLSSTEPFTG
jgi:hypothetical protein